METTAVAIAAEQATRGIGAYLKASGAVKTFKSFGQVSKWTLVVMFFVGWILLACLVFVDLRRDEWWHRLSYVPNIAAGLTGFLIGAPVALILLASFTIEREDRTALERVNRLTKIAWDEFCDSVFALCSNQRMIGLSTHTAQVYNEYARAVGIFANYRMSEHTDTDFQYFQSSLYAHLPKWQQALAVINQAVRPNREIQLLWSAVLSNWSTLDQYVRLQRLERNLPWFHSVLHADIRNHLSNTENPVRFFSLVHDESKSAYSNVSAAYAQSSNFWLRLDKEQFDRGYLYVGSGGTGFPWTITTEYTEKATAAYNELRSLESAVIDVQKARWPENAVQPVGDI